MGEVIAAAGASALSAVAAGIAAPPRDGVAVAVGAGERVADGVAGGGGDGGLASPQAVSRAAPMSAASPRRPARLTIAHPRRKRLVRTVGSHTTGAGERTPDQRPQRSASRRCRPLPTVRQRLATPTGKCNFYNAIRAIGVTPRRNFPRRTLLHGSRRVPLRRKAFHPRLHFSPSFDLSYSPPASNGRLAIALFDPAAARRMPSGQRRRGPCDRPHHPRSDDPEPPIGERCGDAPQDAMSGARRGRLDCRQSPEVEPWASRRAASSPGS